jgi:Kef-type K+ transport system membrane component KefB
MAPNITDIIFLILKILGIFAVLLIGAIIIIPRIVNPERLWKARGSIEGIVTASFFGASAIAAAVGLSPIVGAFSVGMAVAGTKIIKRVEEYVDKLEIIFAPLFFAIIGAQVNLTGVNFDVLFLSAIVVAVAIFSKLVGCGLPAMMFLREKSKAMKVGLGMISRGEVGLIVAGIGVTSGALSSNIYTTVIIMVAITTLITPIWLKKAYGKEPAVANDDSKPMR